MTESNLRQIYYFIILLILFIKFWGKISETYLEILFYISVFLITVFLFFSYLNQTTNFKDKKIYIISNLMLIIFILISIFIVYTMVEVIDSARYDGLSLYGAFKLFEISYYLIWIFIPGIFLLVGSLYLFLRFKVKSIKWNFYLLVFSAILLNLDFLFYFIRYNTLIYFTF